MADDVNVTCTGSASGDAGRVARQGSKDGTQLPLQSALDDSTNDPRETFLALRAWVKAQQRPTDN